MFNLVLPSFTGFYRVLLGFTEFYWVLPSFTGFYRVLLVVRDSFLDLLSFTGIYRFFSNGFCIIFPSFTQYHPVVLNLHKVY